MKIIVNGKEKEVTGPAILSQRDLISMAMGSGHAYSVYTVTYAKSFGDLSGTLSSGERLAVKEGTVINVVDELSVGAS